MKRTWHCSSGMWDRVAQLVKHALVYLDNPCAEMLHWHGGLPRLLHAGAQDVREFSAFESAPESVKKAVFVVSSLLSGVTADTLKDIITNSNFQYVVVVTAVSPQVHQFCQGQSMEGDFTHYFSTFEEEKLLQWMKNINYTAEVLHIPLFSVDVCRGFFVTPGFASLFPLLNSDLKQVELQYHARLPDSRMLVCGMDGMLDGLGAKEDIYSLGHLSRIVATELENYPPARVRRKKASSRLSLIFVDRTLDVASPLSQQFSCLLDKLKSVLPCLPGHSIDVQVDMAPLCSVHSAGSKVIAPGSLASITSGSGAQHLDILVHKKIKEGMMEINRQLVEAASVEKMPLKLSGKRPQTSSQLESVLSLFKGRYAALSKHLDVVEMAAAVQQVLEKEGEGDGQANLLLEKTLVQALNEEEGGEGALGHLLDLVTADHHKPRSERQYGLDDVLWALTFLYSLTGGEEEEKIVTKFQALLAKMVDEATEVSLLWEELCTFAGGLERKGQLAVEQIWSKLEALGAARNDLSKFRAVLEPGSAVSPPCLSPLLKQLTEQIFSPEKPDLVDVTCRSSAVKDLLGMFLSVSKSRPGDQPVLIIFVLGGVTATEVKLIHDTVEKSRTSCQVIVGSTQLARGKDILQAVFGAKDVNLT